MAVKDIKSNLLQLVALNANIVTDVTTNGAIIDTADFELGLMFALFASVLSDGEYELVLEQSEDATMSTGVTDISGDQLIGTLPTIDAVAGGGATIPTVGVISNDRYVRATIDSTNTSSGAFIYVLATEKAENMPVT